MSMTAVINNTLTITFQNKSDIAGIIREFLNSNEQRTIRINKKGDPLIMTKGIVGGFNYAK